MVSQTLVWFSSGVPQGHQVLRSPSAPTDQVLGDLAPTTSVPSCSLPYATPRQLSGSPSSIPGMSHPRAFAPAVPSTRVSCPPGLLSPISSPGRPSPITPILLKIAPHPLLIFIALSTTWQKRIIFCHRQPVATLPKVRTSSSPLDLQSLEQCLAHSRCSVNRFSRNPGNRAFPTAL